MLRAIVRKFSDGECRCISYRLALSIAEIFMCFGSNFELLLVPVL